MAERNLQFDQVVDRRNTGCLKYDFAVQRNMPADVLPLWVADMDFPTSSYIQDAMLERTKHGIFGYSDPLDGYFEAVKGWMKNRHNWSIENDWIIKTPGIVFALAMAVKAFTKPGEPVLVQSPVYYPFYEVIADNQRQIVSNDLILGDDGFYHIDFADFEKKIIENQISLFFLCNPHNPVGRVWTEEELRRIGEICHKHGVIVISDEIHQDFVFEGKHTVFSNLDPSFADFTVTCTSPSKTFNIAGLLLSNIVISNEKLRKLFQKQVDAAGISQLGALSLVACEAAYRDGGEWYDAMKAYLAENIEFAKNFIHDNLPGVEMIGHQGTYLIWLDFRQTGLSVDALEDLIINKAKLWLDSGKIFGDSGNGFQRINVACPRSVLQEALERIQKALCA